MAGRQHVHDLAQVNERAGGEFTVQVYAGGTLGRDPNQQDRMVQSGIADMAVIIPGRNPGAYPHWGIFELPGMARSSEEGSYALWQMHQEGTLAIGDVLQVIAAWTTDPYIVHTREPVTGLDALRNLRVRVLGQTQTQTMLALGSVPQAVSITETPEAISRGTLDGSLADWAVFDIFRIPEVTNHSYTLPLGVLAMAVVMNPDSFAALSPAGQAVMREAGEEWQRMLSAYYVRERARITGTYTERGHQIHEASEADITAMLAATTDVRATVISQAGDEAMSAYARWLDHYRATRN